MSGAEEPMEEEPMVVDTATQFADFLAEFRNQGHIKGADVCATIAQALLCILKLAYVRVQLDETKCQSSVVQLLPDANYHALVTGDAALEQLKAPDSGTITLAWTLLAPSADALMVECVGQRMRRDEIDVRSPRTFVAGDTYLTRTDVTFPAGPGSRSELRTHLQRARGVAFAIKLEKFKPLEVCVRGFFFSNTGMCSKVLDGGSFVAPKTQPVFADSEKEAAPRYIHAKECNLHSLSEYSQSVDLPGREVDTLTANLHVAACTANLQLSDEVQQLISDKMSWNSMILLSPAAYSGFDVEEDILSALRYSVKTGDYGLHAPEGYFNACFRDGQFMPIEQDQTLTRKRLLDLSFTASVQAWATAVEEGKFFFSADVIDMSDDDDEEEGEGAENYDDDVEAGRKRPRQTLGKEDGPEPKDGWDHDKLSVTFMTTEWMRADNVGRESNAAQQYLRRLNKLVLTARDEGDGKKECQSSFRLRSAMEQTCFWNGKSAFMVSDDTYVNCKSQLHECFLTLKAATKKNYGIPSAKMSDYTKKFPAKPRNFIAPPAKSAKKVPRKRSPSPSPSPSHSDDDEDQTDYQVVAKDLIQNFSQLKSAFKDQADRLKGQTDRLEAAVSAQTEGSDKAALPAAGSEVAIEALYINFLENVVKQTFSNEREGRKSLAKAVGSFGNDQLLTSDRFKKFCNDIKITWNSSSAIDQLLE